MWPGTRLFSRLDVFLTLFWTPDGSQSSVKTRGGFNQSRSATLHHRHSPRLPPPHPTRPPRPSGGRAAKQTRMWADVAPLLPGSENIIHYLGDRDPQGPRGPGPCRGRIYWPITPPPITPTTHTHTHTAACALIHHKLLFLRRRRDWASVHPSVHPMVTRSSHWWSLTKDPVWRKKNFTISTCCSFLLYSSRTSFFFTAPRAAIVLFLFPENLTQKWSYHCLCHTHTQTNTHSH